MAVTMAPMNSPKVARAPIRVGSWIEKGASRRMHGMGTEREWLARGLGVGEAAWIR
jgi:hypothetical protein